MSEQHSSDWSHLLRPALACHQAGRWAEAEALYRQTLQAQPRQHDALRLLGVLLRQRGDLAQARASLRQALQVQPDSAQAHQDLGLVHFEAGEFAEAARCFDRALELRPQFPEALHNRANLCLAQGRLEEAARFLEKALEQAPEQRESRSSLEWIRQTEAGLTALAEDCAREAHGRFHPRTGAGSPDGSARLPTRDLFPHLLNRLGLTGRGAEVGVQSGEYSEQLLRSWRGDRLYSIDPWREYATAAYVDVANVPQSQHDQLYCQTLRRLRPFEGRSVVWRLTSKEAAELVDGQSLDFCYLDADHSYQAVAEDIALWYDKVKAGGILAGHDFIPDGTYPFGVFGVQRAVQEFVRARGLTFFLSAEPQFPSWFVVKRSADKAREL